MITFSVATQTVTDPVTGTRVRFEADRNDSGIVRCMIGNIGTADKKADAPNDYYLMSFNRNGLLIENRMVDAEVEADAKARAEAQARLGGPSAPAQAATDEDRKAAEAKSAKQAEDDKALLASAPKVSKYEPKVEQKAPAP